jgi:hypothetical protein
MAFAENPSLADRQKLCRRKAWSRGPSLQFEASLLKYKHGQTRLRTGASPAAAAFSQRDGAGAAGVTALAAEHVLLHPQAFVARPLLFVKPST